MRLGPIIALATMLFATAATASDVRILSFPDGVHGAWAPSADACNGRGAGKISVDGRTYSSADASCEISWITVTASRDGPAYSARSVCTRNGQRQEPSYFLVTPRPDSTLLVRRTDTTADEGTIYRRCL